MDTIGKVSFIVLLLMHINYSLKGQNTQISGGHLHTIFKCASGVVYHAGDRNNNQDGTGIWAGTNNPNPVAVPGVGGAGSLSNIRMIDAGSTHHTLALTETGEVLAFGNDYVCQLGQGGTAGSYPANPSPVRGVGGVGTLTGMKFVAGSSESSYAIRESDGALFAWGSNSVGQLGVGYVTPWPNPQICNPVAVLAPCNSNVIQVDGGDNYAMALLANGTVYAWGENSNGQCGIGTTTDISSPAQVLISPGVPLTNVVSISCGDGAGYAIRNDGTLWAWGHNGWGQLGLGNCTSPVTYATQVTTGDQGHASGFLRNVTQVVGGNAHAVILTSDGLVYTMGSDSHGQLGDGTVGGADACGTGVGARNRPYRVTTLSGIVGVSEGDAWSFAVSSSGTVYAWGQNNEGQLGVGSQGTNVPSPTLMSLPGGCTVLPVNLLSFELNIVADQVILFWTTTKEEGVSNFEVQRSVNGSAFEIIGSVKAYGTSNEVKNYSFSDGSVYNNIAYYRLKIIDNDGSFEYSHIKAINKPIQSELKIYPQPSMPGSEVIIQGLFYDEIQPGQIQLFNNIGKVVPLESVTLRNDNTISFFLPADIISGLYYLKINLSDENKELKFLIY
ncbi:MAG: T9SS type A sorting domain-containing protein [Cytophagaceae bacterium]